MVWASRWSVALRAFYRQILSLLYTSFFFSNFRPRLARELLVYVFSCTSRPAAVLWLMLRVPAIQSGGAAGTSFALIWHLLQSFERSPAPSTVLDLACVEPGLFDIHLSSLVIGVVIGLILGPILEAICALRSLLFQISARKGAEFVEASRSYYKLC